MELFDVMSWLIDTNASEGNIEVYIEQTEPYTDEKVIKEVKSIVLDKSGDKSILVIK